LPKYVEPNLEILLPASKNTGGRSKPLINIIFEFLIKYSCLTLLCSVLQQGIFGFSQSVTFSKAGKTAHYERYKLLVQLQTVRNKTLFPQL
jgi:hypothetical protein